MSNTTFWPATLASIALLGLPAAVQAAHPLVTDDTGTQGTGNWQFEANTDHTRSRASGATTWDRELNVALTRGMSDTLDLAVNVPWLHHSATGESTEDGVGDVTVLAKWRFHDNGHGWTLGLRPEITLPTGSESRGLGNGRATTSLTLLSQVASGPWTWLANAGYTYNDNRQGDRKDLWAASTAVLYNLGERWTLAADIGAARGAAPGSGSETFGLVGAIYHLDENTDLDIGWRRNRSDDPSSHTVGVGYTRRW